jgi:hypothetical protein
LSYTVLYIPDTGMSYSITASLISSLPIKVTCFSIINRGKGKSLPLKLIGECRGLAEMLA